MAVAVQSNPLEEKRNAIKRKTSTAGTSTGAPKTNDENPNIAQNKLEAMERMSRKDVTGRDDSGRVLPDKIRNEANRTLTPTPTTAQGETAYDLRRQQIEAYERAERERQGEGLEKRLQSQHLSGGIADAQKRLLEATNRKIEASRLGEVDIQELLAKQNEQAQNKELAFKEKELAQQAEQFTSKQDFDKWALEQGLDENEKNRIWQEKQTKQTQKFTKEMTELQNELQQKNLTFAQNLQNKAKTDALKSDAAYNLGISGKNLSSDEYKNLSDIEKAAYKAGKAGMSLNEYNDNKQKLIDQKNAIITSIDVDNPDFAVIFEKLFGLPEGITVEQFQKILAKQKEKDKTEEKGKITTKEKKTTPVLTSKEQKELTEGGGPIGGD